QAVGTFIYVESLTDDFQVQTVQKPWYTGAQVSVNTAFAIGIDGQTFVYDSELAIGQELKVNGVTYNLNSGGSALFGNTRIQRSGNQYTFTYAGLDGNFSTADDNDVVIASDYGSLINVSVNPSDDRAGLLQGLLGNGDGDSTNDFALRDGTGLGPNPSVQTIHTTFADSWRVGKGESLFQTTTFLTTLTKSTTVSPIDVSPIGDTSIDISLIDIIEPTPDPEPVPFPKEFISLETLAKQDSDAVANAFAIAREFGIAEGAFLNGAAFDFLVTGDKTFLLGAKQAANLALQSEFQNGDTATSLGSIQGSKWNDANANGIWDEGEKALAGWTIYIDSVTNGKLDPWEISTVTNADGQYTFSNLGPGEYAILEVNQTGWIQTFPTIPYALNLTAGENLTGINFGNNLACNAYTFVNSYTTGEIGRVNTLTGLFTPIPNDTLNPNFFDIAYDGSSLWGITSGGVLYKINVTTGTRTSIGSAGAFINGLDFDNTGNLYGTGGNGFYTINKTTGAATLQATLPGVSSSGDIVWNGTGFYETSLSGTGDILYSVSTAGVVTSIGSTGFNNIYGLAYDGQNLLGYTANNQQIQINTTTGAGFNPIPLTGYASGFSSGGAASICPPNIKLGGIKGSKWNDINSNGVWDTGEQALAGWTIYIDSNKNGQFDAGELSTVTDANGQYTFSNLGPGEYTIGEVAQTGWEQTYPTTPYSIDLKTGAITGSPNPYISLITSPTDSNGDGYLETVVKVNYQAQLDQVKFIVNYDKSPTGWTLNIGDSATNDGYKGDASTQSNDAELQILNQNLTVYGNDYTPTTLNPLANITNFANNVNSVELVISNGQVVWNSPNAVGSLNTPYLYALNGQPDAEGPVNYDVYASLNRVINGTYRIGSGASKVTIIPVNKGTHKINLAAGQTATGINFGNRPSTLVTLNVTPSSVTEDGITNLVYTFTRLGSTTNPLTVNFGVAGTATFATDYTQTGAATLTSSTGTITFAAGAATTTLIVDPTADTTVEADETVALSLASGAGYVIAGTPTVTGTIINDDLPTINLSPSSQTVVEGLTT
ncbi:MAG: SdrD B-like domain-containing protein, partial [Dolichospermum sp.]